METLNSDGEKKYVKHFIVQYMVLKSFFSCRKLKLGNGAEVCVQRLMKEEDLGWDFLTAIRIMRRSNPWKKETVFYSLKKNIDQSFLFICTAWRICCWRFRWGCQERRRIILLRSFCGMQGGTAPPGAYTLLWPLSMVSLLTTCSWLNTCLTNTPGCPFPTGWEERENGNRHF